MLQRLLVIFVFISCSSRITYDTGLSATAAGKMLTQAAVEYIGSPYLYGGMSPEGFDCSGFTAFLFNRELNISLPHSSAAQAEKGTKVDINELRAGDLLFFRIHEAGPVNHVAIYISGDSKNINVVHATTSRGVIREDIMNSQYWWPRLVSARRII